MKVFEACLDLRERTQRYLKFPNNPFDSARNITILVNGILDVFTPPVARFFREKYREIQVSIVSALVTLEKPKFL